MKNVINIKKPVIEFDFVDEAGVVIERFEFDRSDEAAEKFPEVRDRALKRIATIDIEGKINRDSLKDFLNLTIDDLLGAGTFAKLYALSPSIEIVVSYFIDICISISEELSSTSTDEPNKSSKEDELLDYYLGKKSEKPQEKSRDK